MRRTWLPLVLVIVVGALVGAAIAGRPKATNSFQIDPAVVAGLGSTTTAVTAGTPAPTSSVITSSSSSPTTTAAEPAETVAPADDPTTTAPASTTDQPTTTAPRTTDRSTLRLVIANADGRTGLAQANADRLAALGYGTIDLGDSPQNLAFTAIYYRAGFLDAAATVAADLAIPNVAILELPGNLTEPLTNSDDQGDVIVLLGADAPR